MRIQAIRWIWLVALALLVSRPAAAEPPTPAPAAAGAAPAEFVVALMDVAPAPGREQVATFIAATVREALRSDPRFAMIPVEEVAEARAAHEGRFAMLTPEEDAGGNAALGVEDAELTYAQACFTGRAVGADRVILLGGYEAGSHTSVEDDPVRNAMHQVTEHHLPSRPAARAEIKAWVAASVMLMKTDSCEVGDTAVLRATRQSQVSEEDARAGARKDFAGVVHEGLARLFPVRSSIRAVTRHGGEMNRGARHGVNEGQYYAVHRDARVVGQVHVDAVASDSARVSLVRGASRLQPGDRLVERDPVYVWEAGISATPSVLARNLADKALGVATAAHLMVYQPISTNMYGLMVERLALPAFARWRAGLEYGRQFRILPRRLFAYARVGLGLVHANQRLQGESGMYYDNGIPRLDSATMHGFELLPIVGMKLALGEGLVLHAGARYPVALHDSEWERDSDRKQGAPDEALVYPHPHRSLPMVTIGAGWRF